MPYKIRSRVRENKAVKKVEPVKSNDLGAHRKQFLLFQSGLMLAKGGFLSY